MADHKHPSLMTDHELASLPATTIIPSWAEVVFVYPSGGLLWACYKNGTIWCRAPLPPEDNLAER